MSTDDTRWQSSKAIYDPCPVGYRIPDGDSSGVWAKAFGRTTDFYGDSFDSTNHGFDFASSASINSLTSSSSVCWYPAASCRRGYNASFVSASVGFNGYYWSCSTEDEYVCHLYFDYSNLIYPSYSSRRDHANAYSVRCFKENSSSNSDPEPEPEPVDAEDISVEGTANSYIVSEAGTYKFRTVQGNSSTSVGTVASAEVLWETFGTAATPNVGDLVSEVSYADGYISFKASSKKGNASIAAKDASGTILWSWHIWMTDQPEDQVYNNNAGTMMDRNLGATSATPGDVGAFGLFYQWGRKDPFLGRIDSDDSSLSESAARAKSTTTWPGVRSNATTGTIAYATTHPTTFIYEDYRREYDDWYYSSSTLSYDNTRWQSSKTIYDPCPPGYRVPDGEVWSKAFGGGSTMIYYPRDEYDLYDGINLGKNDTRKYLTNELTCWYPIIGFLQINNLGYESYNIFAIRGWGDYLSCTPSDDIRGKCYSFTFGPSHSNWELYPSSTNSAQRVDGNPVRCLKENSSSGSDPEEPTPPDDDNKDEDDNSGDINASDIVGSWAILSYEGYEIINGAKTKEYYETTTEQERNNPDYWYIFNADGTAYFDGDNITYSVNGHTLTIFADWYEDEGGSHDINIARLTEETLILDGGLVDEGYEFYEKMTFERVR